VDLKGEGRGDHNEYLVVFHKVDAPNFPQILVKTFLKKKEFKTFLKL